jgi:hypothetical protein
MIYEKTVKHLLRNVGKLQLADVNAQRSLGLED